jgi:hypothetical protein
MRNELAFFILGGVVGYLGYHYYLSQKGGGKGFLLMLNKTTDKAPEKEKGKEKKDSEFLNIAADLRSAREKISEDYIFDDKMLKPFNVYGEVAEPKMEIYTQKIAHKPQVNLNDLTVERNQRPTRIIQLK